MDPLVMTILLVFGYILIGVTIGVIIHKHLVSLETNPLALCGAIWPLALVILIIYKFLKKPIIWLFG